MSYLNTPRVCFRGTYNAAGPTRNNLLAALDDPTILAAKPPWNFDPTAGGDFSLADCLVTSAWDDQGRLIQDASIDPLIGARVSGAGKMADLDPEHRRVTDLVGMNLVVTLPGADSLAGVSGQLKITQLRDYWSNASRDTSTAWQSVLDGLLWSGDYQRSPVLDQLHDASPEGLSVRITPLQSGFPKTGRVVGVIGPWDESEPGQFVAGRRLMTQLTAGQYTFPVASALVDERRRKLVVDLSNLPVPAQQKDSDPRLTGLGAATVQRDAEGGQVTLLGPLTDVKTGDWLKTSGIVKWDLDSVGLADLRDRRVRVTFTVSDRFEPDNPSESPFATRFLVMEEHPSELFVDVDGRSLRLNPGESAELGVYARSLGQPVSGLVVQFGLHRQLAIAAVESILPQPTLPGYPTDPGEPINSEPRDVLLSGGAPLRVETDCDGFARLRVEARPGPIDLPPPRRTIDSQLYFLGEPDGWQTWGALGPNSGVLQDSHRVGAGCALAVLVFNTHHPIPNPTWDDVKDWLARYAYLYPVMQSPQIRLDLGDKSQVDASAQLIVEKLTLDRENPGHMPVSRDLSEFRRQTILGYLRSVMPVQQPAAGGP